MGHRDCSPLCGLYLATKLKGKTPEEIRARRAERECPVWRTVVNTKINGSG